MNRIHNKSNNEPDMTPMVDVTFLLLIFFMVTAAFTLQRSIEVPNPTSQLASPNPIDIVQEEPVLLRVDQYGGFSVRTASWEREFVGKQNLIRGLREASGQVFGAASGQANTNACLEIAVEPDARLQWMVDALDAGSIAGFQKIQISETLSTHS